MTELHFEFGQQSSELRKLYSFCPSFSRILTSIVQRTKLADVDAESTIPQVVLKGAPIMKKIVALVMALCLVLCCCSAVAEDKVYNIGVLQFVQHDALDAATQGFQDALKDKLGDKVVIDVKNASGDTANCATIANTFVSDGVDLIMANATPALQACIAATADIPILGTSVTAYDVALEIDDWKGYSEINVSGTSDLAPLNEQAAMVKELFPAAKTVALLYCSAEANSEYQVKVMETELAALGFTTERFAFTDSNDVAALAEQATSCDVIYIPTDNTAAAYKETIANVVVPASKPVIAGEEGICVGCGVATLTITYYDIGYKTGEMAYDVLVNGADISTMEVAFAPQFTKKYNAEIAASLGVTIPEDYTAIAK